MKLKKTALTGGEAVAYALKQIDIDVFSMYPITPQTPIVESFSNFHAEKKVNTHLILVESEHSALSATIGAAASGARCVTASASQGLLYMYEMLSIASGLRLPIVMPVANRAISSPINIHCDHSDIMSCLDQGWMIMFCENAQEAYQATIFGTKFAERCLLPLMVCMDGFYTSHNLENITLYEDQKVKRFVGNYKAPYNLLDTKKPISIGMLALPDSFFEIKAQVFKAFEDSKKIFFEVSKDFEKTFKKKFNIYEEYKTKDAHTIIVLLSSTAQTTKNVIDRLRGEGKKVGLLRPILFRPFCYEEYFKALKHAKQVVVLDRSEGIGSLPPVYKEIKLALSQNQNIKVYSHVFGLGGRELYEKDIESLLKGYVSGKPFKKKYLGLKK